MKWLFVLLFMLVGFVIMKFLLKFEDEIQDFPEETL